jgi:peptidoglycan-associated lipoprotein
LHYYIVLVEADMYRGKLWSLFWITVSVSVLCFLTGCAKKVVDGTAGGTLPTEEVAETAVGADTDMRMGTGRSLDESSIVDEGMSTRGAFSGEISEGRSSAPMSPIYFDFDRYNIRDEMKPRMEENARILLDHATVRIEIQGNCDERGTNEYNLALGERRAKSAKAYLSNLGVNPDRIEILSYGEENPLATGHDETAWKENRRDDFVSIK